MTTFVNKDYIKDFFRNKRVALFGSAPSCLENDGNEINKYDLIVRVNNYKIKGFEGHVGARCDVFYSFFGSSIRKSAEELKNDGVKLCMCKCPDAFCFDHNVSWDPKNVGSDFRPIYRRRKSFWFCDTYIPTKDDFLEYFNYLDKHIPTTGFSCILDLIQCEPKELYITGFDGFKSGKHNVNEKWREKNRNDPIAHQPKIELKLIKIYPSKYKFIKLDRNLSEERKR